MATILFTLPEEKKAALQEMAAKTSQSMASIIRQGVDEQLAKQFPCSVCLSGGQYFSGYAVLMRVG